MGLLQGDRYNQNNYSHYAENDNYEEKVQTATNYVQVLRFSLKSTQKCDVSDSHSCEITGQAVPTHRKKRKTLAGKDTGENL